MMKKTKGWLYATGVLLACTAFPAQEATAGHLSPGVTYESGNGYDELHIDLQENHTYLNVNYPRPLNQLETTLQQAQNVDREGQAFVGAVNASFFDMQHSLRLPFSLITDNNQIVNYGRVSQDNGHYRSEPIAFGIDASGQAMIDHYESALSATSGDHTFTIDNMNASRAEHTVNIYTPDHVTERTGTNQYGVEVVVRGVEQDTENFAFGDRLEGTIEEITSYGDPGNKQIPQGGFVLSAHGQAINHFSKLEEGDPIHVDASIDSQWQNAEIMIGSGPQLVRNGDIDISMDASSWRASQKTQRTAVGINQADNEVFLVTTDDMTITQMARHMRDLGADRALNFDGGGSTTMIGRIAGDLQVLNAPAQSGQRHVSSTLQVLYSGDVTTPQSVTIATGGGIFLTGATFVPEVNALNALNENIELNEDRQSWQVTSAVGSVSGDEVTAEASGEGSLQLRYDEESLSSTNFTVTDRIDDWGISEITTNVGETETITIEPKTTDGSLIRYDGIDVSYEVSGDVGQITNDGVFTAEAAGEGEITMQIGEHETTIPVTVEEAAAVSPFSDITNDYTMFNEIMFGVERGYFGGHSDGTFRPSNPVKRSQIAAVLVSEFGLRGESAPDPGYTDVDENFPTYDAISIATANDWITGRHSGAFEPNAFLTRAQMALILTRAYGLEVGDETIDFPDVPDDYFAADAIQALASNGLTTGYRDGNFGPGDNVNRAQFASFMKRIVEFNEE